MKKTSVVLLALVMILMLSACTASSQPAAPSSQAAAPAASAESPAPSQSAAWKPSQPVTIMNYVKAGGGMDIATRKFVEIAAKYTDATFVVDNTPGAGGMTAMEYVLSQPADGYTVFAGTVSNIAYLIANEEDLDRYIWGLTWIDDIMADPYSIMVSKDSGIKTLDDLIAACKNGSVWCGPSTGGAKHLTALQFWGALGIENATWVPFESGPDALLAVIGGQGVASVGNACDVEGRDLRNIVIATKDKLEKYPDVPNFAECGYPELDALNMWRGFAVKDGTPQEMITWFQNLVDQVTADKDWQTYFADNSVLVFNKTTEEFESIIEDNIASYTQILKDLEMIDQSYNSKAA